MLKKTFFAAFSENTNDRLLPKQKQRRMMYFVHQPPKKDPKRCNGLATLPKERNRCFHFQQPTKDQNRHFGMNKQAGEHRHARSQTSSQKWNSALPMQDSCKCDAHAAPLRNGPALQIQKKDPGSVMPAGGKIRYLHIPKTTAIWMKPTKATKTLK